MIKYIYIYSSRYLQSQSLQPIFLLRVKDRFRAFETLIKRLDDLLTFPSSTCQLERIPRELDIRRLSMYTRRESISTRSSIFSHQILSRLISVGDCCDKGSKKRGTTRVWSTFRERKSARSIDLGWEIGEAIPLVQETNKREMAEEEDSR